MNTNGIIIAVAIKMENHAKTLRQIATRMRERALRIAEKLPA